MQVYGIDLSKENFDVNFLNASGNEMKKRVKNNLISISKFLEEVPSGSILCAEHTGIYGDLLVHLCNALDMPIALVPGYTIKHSLGLLKGKSDPIDAGRIREYGERFEDKLETKKFVSEEMYELRSLYTLRTQLVKQRKELQTSNKELTMGPIQNISVHKHFIQVKDILDQQIKEIEQEIEKLVSSNQQFKETYDLSVSIIGIGPVIATDLIIKTGNFEIIETARKASSYAGVCPFPNSSGKMISKAKTSPFADKKLKSLLHMGAKAAIKHNKEFRLYYQKKRLEGKPHYLILNNVSNKLLRTVYSVVKNKTPYQQNYVCLDPREKNNNVSDKIVA